jgi:UDP-N-acetylmuramoylalanine--D-glutamate ligase
MREIRGKLNHSHITVAGLGRFGGGIEVSRWLVAQGAHVLVTDKESPQKLAESVKKLDGLPIEFRLGEHRESDFTSCDLLVTSPAIAPHSEYLQAAKRAGVPITTEIRLFIERCPARIVGVTATKGKSTTTALLGLMLKTKFNTFVGGNLGGSLLFELPKITASDLVVLELSSYMLEHLRPMQWSPHLALVGMIGVDHVEWHGSADAYADAKRNIVRFQKPEDFAVINEENETSMSFARDTKARIMRFGLKDRQPIQLNIAGAHNQLNAQGALAAALAMGVSRDVACSAVRDFKGLPHRLQLVNESNGVRWINDSIATIPQAAVAAMESFPAGRVIQIVGGYDKGLDMTEMCNALAGNCKAILTIGKLGPSLAEKIRQAPNRSAELFECESLDRAVQKARQLASVGDIVMLSTGCASYDQFDNFEQRGEAFAKLARG